MKTVRIMAAMSLTLLILGCGSSQKIVETNPALDTMMENRSFEIKVRSAEPQVTQAMAQVANSGMLPPGNTISRIDVSGAGYFIKVDGDFVSANLPYYGERRMGGGYNSDAGIEFEGQTENLEITKDPEKYGYTVKFSQGSSSETYFIKMEVNRSMNSTTLITSSHRNRIRYSGVITEIQSSE